MFNPFVKNLEDERSDETLIASALRGNREDLETLIARHQDWIYNIALRMVWNPQDAEDITQETLIKIITKLSTFKGKSRFRTWAYRIVANHVINMKKRGLEKYIITFRDYWNDIEKTPDQDLPDPNTIPVDLPLIVEETKIQCMMGMLLCLDRQQRLTFILGEIFGVTDAIGSEILEIRRAAFRQRLSRARRQVYNFMNEKCGLVKRENPCHCERKTKALMDDGSIDPGNLTFNSNFYHRVRTVSRDRQRQLEKFVDNRCRALFRDHPFKQSPDLVKPLRRMLQSNEFRRILDF